MALRLALTSDLPFDTSVWLTRVSAPHAASFTPRITSYGVMTRRMMLLVLAVMGVMVLVVTVSPPEPGGDRNGRESGHGDASEARL